MRAETVILMVEDDEGHALLIKRSLSKAGITNQVHGFCDGQEFLNFCEEQMPFEHQKSGPFILLLDIRMPKMDGIDVLRTVKGSPIWKNLPVVMLTTTSNPQEVDLCHELGCNAYVVKPVSSTDFTETIQSLADFLKKMELPSFPPEVMATQ